MSIPMFWGQWTTFWNRSKLSTFILCKNLQSNNFKMAAMCHFSAQILEYEIHRSKIWCLDLCFWNQGAQFYITLHFQPTSNAKIWYICVVTISKWPPWGIFVLISANINPKETKCWALYLYFCYQGTQFWCHYKFSPSWSYTKFAYR